MAGDVRRAVLTIALNENIGHVLSEYKTIMQSVITGSAARPAPPASAQSAPGGMHAQDAQDSIADRENGPMGEWE
jgi:hypothetical protein